MTAIPEDVWTRIAQMVERLADEHEASSHTQEEKAGFLFDAIAALILSEREAAQREERDRCAKIVERYQSFPPPTSRAARYHLQHCVKPNIAAAILQEPKA